MSSKKVSRKLVQEIVDELERRKAKAKKEMKIPLSVFSTRKLTAFEALVVHLKDDKSYTYHEIAMILQRDDRTIWNTYKRAKNKISKK